MQGQLFIGKWNIDVANVSTIFINIRGNIEVGSALLWDSTPVIMCRALSSKIIFRSDPFFRPNDRLLIFSRSSPQGNHILRRFSAGPRSISYREAFPEIPLADLLIQEIVPALPSKLSHISHAISGSIIPCLLYAIFIPQQQTLVIIQCNHIQNSTVAPSNLNPGPYPLILVLVPLASTESTWCARHGRGIHLKDHPVHLIAELGLQSVVIRVFIKEGWWCHNCNK